MIFRRDPLADPEPLVRRVYSYVAYRIGHGPDAEDVTSETFVRALRYRDRYDPAKGEPIAWLLGIARHCIDDLARSAAPPGTAVHEPATAGDLEDETARSLTIRAAVAALTERERELIALRYGADLSARTIAGLFGMKTNAVEVALHRARLSLRHELESEGAGGVEATSDVRKPPLPPVEGVEA